MQFAGSDEKRPADAAPARRRADSAQPSRRTHGSARRDTTAQVARQDRIRRPRYEWSTHAPVRIFAFLVGPQVTPARGDAPYP